MIPYFWLSNGLGHFGHLPFFEPTTGTHTVSGVENDVGWSFLGRKRKILAHPCLLVLPWTAIIRAPPLELWNRFILTRTPPKVFIYIFIRAGPPRNIWKNVPLHIYHIYMYTRIDLSRPELVQKSYFYRQLKSQGGVLIMENHRIRIYIRIIHFLA